MTRPKPRTHEDLSPAGNPDAWNLGYSSGVLAACNLLDDIFLSCQLHPNLLGDCILAKLNLLAPKRKIRKNPKWKATISE